MGDLVKTGATIASLCLAAVGLSYGFGKDAGSSATAANVTGRLGAVEKNDQTQDQTIKDLKADMRAFGETVTANSEATRKAVERMVKSGTVQAKGTK